jgi:branched-chain amino acid transport system substrate-binding protein
MNRIFQGRKKYLRIVIVLMIIFVTAAAAFNMISCDSRERIIKIGSQAVLSGEYKSFGEDQLVSLELAVSALSPVRIGGFDYNIELVTRDDEGSPEKAFLVAQELVDQGAILVIGSTFDGTTRVSIPVYEEYDIPLVSPFAQKTETALVGDNFYRVIINNRQKVENIADFVLEQAGTGRLMLIDNREEYSIELTDYLEELLKGSGKDILRRYSIDAGGEDFVVLADNVLIEEPDHIFCALNYNELAKLIMEVKNAGIEPVFMTETMGMSEHIFDVTVGADLDGLMAIIPEPPSIAMYSTDQRAIDFWHSYNEMLETLKQDTDLSISGPGQFSTYVFDSLMLSIEAMRRSNSILPQDFIQELKATSYEGLTGHIEFDSNGDRVDPPSTVFIIRDGVWVRYNP